MRPRTSKGITDLLSLSLVRLFSSAACPSKKSLSSWEPAVALVTYRDPAGDGRGRGALHRGARTARTTEARDRNGGRAGRPARAPADRAPPVARGPGTRMARPRPTAAVYGGRTRSGIPGRADGDADAGDRGRRRRAHAVPGLPA